MMDTAHDIFQRVTGLANEGGIHVDDAIVGIGDQHTFIAVFENLGQQLNALLRGLMRRDIFHHREDQILAILHRKSCTMETHRKPLACFTDVMLFVGPINPQQTQRFQLLSLFFGIS